MTVKVKQLVTDKWVGLFCEEEQNSVPTLRDVRRAIESLDAKERTIVSLLSGDGRSVLTIGGGSGRYVVYLSVGDEEFWNLINENGGEGVVILNAGGQEGDFPERQIVDKDTALLAADAFFKTGERDGSLTWELQE